MKSEELENQIESLPRVSNKRLAREPNQSKNWIIKERDQRTKDFIKGYQHRFTKQDKFFKLEHEKVPT